MAQCGVLIYLWRNLVGYIISRPPIAVLMLFIGALSLCFYTLSYYVQSNEIVDAHSTEIYSGILQSLLQLSFCLSNKTTQLNHTDVQTKVSSFGQAELVNLSFPLIASFSMDNKSQLKDQVKQINGLVPYFYILQGDDHHHSIPIQTSLQQSWSPSSCHGGVCGDIKVCVTMQIKKEVAANRHPVGTCEVINASPNETIFMHTLKSKKKERSMCEQPAVQLNFMTEKEKYIPHVYLDLWVKSKIIGRLHLASYIFFVILISCLIYATMKGETVNGKPPKVVES